MKILLITGEVSADQYGAKLAKELRATNPSSYIYSVGGKYLKAISDEFLFDLAAKSAIGFIEHAAHRRDHQLFLKTFEKFLSSTPIDKAVLVDFQHYHSKVAALLQKNNIPIITFITPNFWIWNQSSKAKKIVSYSQDIVTIYEKEQIFYKKFTSHTRYFGHPINHIKPLPHISSHYKRVTLFPGSRKQEITQLLPSMLEVVQILKEKRCDYHFQIALSASDFKDSINTHCQKANLSDIPIVEVNERLFSQTDFVLCSTGTTSLEAVIHHLPVIILLAANPITYFIVKYILRLPIEFVGLPNIIAGRRVVSEYIQYQIKPQKIAEEIHQVLSHPENIQDSIREYDPIIASLGNKSPFESVAQLVLRGDV
ncbi:MAG: hypothetical protein HRT90_08320 [Candidatus Margulisbacteria bacterium]|nr:hypothetical protein [Candidatus Margulisiibacteriota bacterium]